MAGASSRNILRTDSPIVGVLVEQHERRLIATQHIAAGTRLFHVEGHETETPSRHSLQVGWNLHLDQSAARDPNDRVARFYWRYMNHSCDPATAIRDRDVVALRALLPDDSITFDYNTTEYELADPFDCRCGAGHCVGVVRGARHLTPEQRTRLEASLPDYLK